MLTLDKALHFAGLFSFSGVLMSISYYCELKDKANAFEKLLDVEYIYTLKSKASESGIKEIHKEKYNRNSFYSSSLFQKSS